jgi:NitT/TauT family transport system substrate-binding protein
MCINMSSPTDEVLESIATAKANADDLKLVSVFKPSTDTAKLAERIYVDVFGNA